MLLTIVNGEWKLGPRTEPEPRRSTAIAAPRTRNAQLSGVPAAAADRASRMDFSIASILLLDGATNGAIYALLALAIVLVFAVTRVIFIPQGEFVAYGALTLALLQTRQGAGHGLAAAGAGGASRALIDAGRRGAARPAGEALAARPAAHAASRRRSSPRSRCGPRR